MIYYGLTGAITVPVLFFTLLYLDIVFSEAFYAFILLFSFATIYTLIFTGIFLAVLGFCLGLGLYSTVKIVKNRETV